MNQNGDGMAYPNHTRGFTGAANAAPPPDVTEMPPAPPPERVNGIPERLPVRLFRNRHFHDSVGSSPTAGAVLHAREEIGFEAKTAFICNTSGSTVSIAGTDLRVPPNVTNLVVAFRPFIDHWTASVFTSGSGAGELDVILTEEDMPPTPFGAASVTVSANVNATITGPLASGDAVAAGLPVEDGEYIFNGSTWDRLREVIGDAQAATGIVAAALMLFNGSTYDRLKAGVQAAGASLPVLQGLGATNVNAGQVTAGAAATLVIARATRIGTLVHNHDSTNAATIGPATVTTANGLKVEPLGYVAVTWTGLIQCIANAGSPVLSFWDEYY